jgi:hypothetical protein
MKKNVLEIVFALAVLILGACNLPSGSPPVVTETPTQIPAAAIVLFTDTSTPTLEPVVLSTDTASPVPPPQDPLVVRATLCWQGPGSTYDVVSALNQNERVKLLGRGSLSGWFVVENPTYHDPCWVAEGDLQVDAGTDLSTLRIYNPPPTATPTRPPATPTPTPVVP